MTDTDDDPLAGAAIGETRTIRRSKTLSGIDLEPREFWGSDRQRDVSIADVEIVSDEHDDDIDDIRVAWEGEVTKTLPPRWDQCNEPRTDDERRDERRTRWAKKIIAAALLLVPIGIASVATYYLMQGLSGSMTINGEPVTAPTPVELAASFALLMGITLVILWGIKGGLPRRRGRSI